MNEEQLEQYESRGFLVLKDFVAAEACDRLRRRAEELVRELDPQGMRFHLFYARANAYER